MAGRIKAGRCVATRRKTFWDSLAESIESTSKTRPRIVKPSKPTKTLRKRTRRQMGPRRTMGKSGEKDSRKRKGPRGNAESSPAHAGRHPRCRSPEVRAKVGGYVKIAGQPPTRLCFRKSSDESKS